MFTSPNPKIDSESLKKELEDSSITLVRHRARGDIIPERIELRKGDTTICLVVQEIACHSYVPFRTNDGRTIFLGSLEFLISLYLSLSIFTLHAEDILGARILCQVKEFIKIFRENCRAKKSQFEAFALQCRGHQTRFSSLLREKIKRQEKEKEKGDRSRSKTRKVSKKNKEAR